MFSGIKLNFKVACEYPYYREIWSYKEGDYDGFRSAVGSANWDECVISDDVDNVCESWTEKLLIDKNAVFQPQRPHTFAKALRSKKMKCRAWQAQKIKTTTALHLGETYMCDKAFSKRCPWATEWINQTCVSL